MTRMTPEAMALFEREARLRLESKTNKQLARLTGFAPKYVANLVAKLRRELAQKKGSTLPGGPLEPEKIP
jgi:hypothetical protein